MEQPTETGAVENVTDVESMAAVLENRYNEEPEQEASAEPEQEQEIQSDDQEPESEESEELSFQNVNELAEALEMSPEDFMANIKMTRKINGQEEEVSLAEIREGNQREADYRRKTMELAEQRKSFETEQNAIRQEAESRLTNLATLASSAEHQLNAEYNSVDWQELREIDPAEFTAKQMEFQQRNAQIQNLKQQGAAEYNRLQQEGMQKQQAAFEDFRTKQTDFLLDKVPDWKDQETRIKEETEISQFLADNYGFNADDKNSFIDHRMVLLARDAMRVRSMSDQTELAKKKVKDLPKVLKPSGKQSQKDKLRQAEQSKRERFKKSGSTDDLAALLLDRM